MAVVKEYVTETGVTIRFHDDEYRDKTPEELKAVRDEMNRVASELLYKAMAKKAEEQTA